MASPSTSTTTTDQTSSPKRTMKAWTYTQGGLPHQVLKLSTTHPFPEFPPPKKQPSQKEDPENEEEEEYILVRIKYAALNPGDILVMNLLPTLQRMTFSSAAGIPHVPGYDLTGEVVDISRSPMSSSTGDFEEGGETESKFGFRKGSKVIAFLPISFILSSTGKSGGLQEYISFPAKYAVLLPPSPSGRDTGGDGDGDVLKEAAGLLLAGCTALQQIRNAKLEAGDKVLVYGASGGIGSLAVQLAREVVGSGGYVVGVCSARNLEVIWGLGVCDALLDYTAPERGLYTGGDVNISLGGEERDGNETLEVALKRRYGTSEETKFDGIIDCYGSQKLYNSCAGYLKEQGVYSSCGIHANGYGYGPVLLSGWKILMNNLWPKAKWLWGSGRTWIAASMFDPGREMMEFLVGLFGRGKLRVLRDGDGDTNRDGVWGFEDLLGGYEVLRSGRARGKVVVRVGED